MFISAQYDFSFRPECCHRRWKSQCWLFVGNKWSRILQLYSRWKVIVSSPRWHPDVSFQSNRGLSSYSWVKLFFKCQDPRLLLILQGFKPGCVECEARVRPPLSLLLKMPSNSCWTVMGTLPYNKVNSLRALTEIWFLTNWINWPTAVGNDLKSKLT